MSEEAEATSPSDHLAAVGLVATGWAMFEFQIDFSAIQLGKIPQRAGFCLTAQVIGPARKLDAYIAIARLQGANTFAGELDKFARNAIRLGERRNRVVHDAWYLTKRPLPSRLEITARRVLRAQFVEVETRQLVALAADIKAISDDFDDIHKRIMASITE
jgi:hypothetical protein